MRSAITVFRLFEEVVTRAPAGVSELARALDLPKSTAQRGLLVLHELGWVEPESSTSRRWVQTTKLLALASRAGRPGLREIALPVMHRLLAETNENVHLSVRTREWVTIIERLEGDQVVRPFDPLGEIAPLYASSTGKAMLAWSTDGEIDEVIQRGLQPYTDNTFTDPEALHEELSSARRAGYVVNREEWRRDLRAVAAPLLDESGHPVAAISVAVPAHRLPESRVPVLGELVTSATQSVVVSASTSARRHQPTPAAVQAEPAVERAGEK